MFQTVSFQCPDYVYYINNNFEYIGHVFKFDLWVVQERSMARSGKAVVAAAMWEEGQHIMTTAPN
jgi:hypothetical protein